MPAHVQEIVFAVRGLQPSDLHYYENYGRRYGDEYRHGTGPGRLCRLNLRTGKVRVLLADPEGSVRDPQVHYDAGKVLFSYRPGGTHYYHLYEIDVDDSDLRQLTDGPFDDIEPTYTPGGDIVFISSRCRRRVPCWSSQVGVMYRCDADGGNIRRISAGVEHENTPWMLPDGRVLYTRWEYVDRDEVAYHHLWTVNPDGTRQMTYYGNMKKHGNCVAMLDAKPIPGTDRVVSTFAFHNTMEHAGPVMVIDPDRGPDHLPSARQLNDGYPAPIAEYKYDAHRWRDPYALSEDCFLLASQKSLYVMDGGGDFEPLYTLQDGEERVWVHEPRPLVPRPRERMVPDVVDWSQPTGTLLLSDVTVGRNMPGVERGQVKKLLVLEELPKPVSFSVDPDQVSLVSTFILHRILGTVPVERDGSAYFNLPANRPFFFVALDERGRALKRMMSFVSVLPGEITGCAGCHEPRTMSPPERAGDLLALERAPDRITPIKGVPRVIDYVRDIQPIWDRHCVRCHNYEKFAGGLSLAGDLAPSFTHSYLNLFWKDLVSNGFQGPGNRDPYSIGAVASPLMKELKEGHEDVELTRREMDRIRLWIESSAAFAGTYGALGTGSVKVKVDENVLKRRCASCHGPSDLRNRWTTGWSRVMGHRYNLSRPEKSPALLAPLSGKGGGLGLCLERSAAWEHRGEDAPPADVFTSRADPDYQRLLADVRAAAERAARTPRHFTPDFRPRPEYVEEMQRFGVLPSDFAAKNDPLDTYATDRAYWGLFWHRSAPPGETPTGSQP